MSQEDQITEELVDVKEHPSALNIQTESNGFISKDVIYSEVHNENLDQNLQNPIYYTTSSMLVYFY